MPLDQQLEEAVAAYFNKVDSGESVDPIGFIRAHPNLAIELKDFFESLGLINTLLDQATTDPAGDAEPQPIPASIDRYEIQTILGEGGFGRVFLGYDQDLERHVAIKVPHAHRVRREDQRTRFLEEGRSLARLRHPSLLSVFNVGEEENGLCYMVMEYIEGQSLAQKLIEADLGLAEAVKITTQIADGIQAAHDAGVIHRDIKPSNILIDDDDRIYIADFGLAIRDERPWEQDGQLAGTRAYMAPEQLHGEIHRIDVRTDVWAIGVLLYELLTKKRPFQHRLFGLNNKAANRDPKPLRSIDDSIPSELERVCLKCLQSRMADRFATAHEVAEALRNVTSTMNGSAVATVLEFDEVAHQVVPPGVRNFDESAAEVYATLVPGLRDATGAPETLSFWVRKLNCMTPEETFLVGVIYGPSGSGKSSFIKAGILPRIDQDIRVASLEATKLGFEKRLIDALKNALPTALEEDGWRNLPLAAVLGRCRQWCIDREQKLVIVVDQFEQWLSAWDGEVGASHLEAALRQCDGAALQCILIVRDDFWLALSRFMRGLEEQIVDGENAQLIDLFDTQHAKKVLRGFGRSYKALPPYPESLSAAQQEFVDRAVQQLSRDRKISPVQLALMAEMIKEEEWEPGLLDSLGGMRGIGVRFLEETFKPSKTSKSHPQKHPSDLRAVQNALRLLLPPASVEQALIKGQSRSSAELSAVTGFDRDSQEFCELMRVLEKETCLVTPVDPIGGETKSDVQEERRYQLTHDYLVPSLQEWLHQTDALTWPGRARQMLQRLHGIWSTSEDHRHLPRLTEWAQISAVVPRRKMTQSQLGMMRQTEKRLLFYFAGVVGCMLFCAFLAWQAWGGIRSNHLTENLASARSEEIPTLLDMLDAHHRWTTPQLNKMLLSTGPQKTVTNARIHMALVRRDRSHAEPLLQHLRTARLDELGNIIGSLQSVNDTECGLDELWQEALANQTGKQARLRIAALLANRTASDPRWEFLADEVAHALTHQPPMEHGRWASLLRPVARHFLEPFTNMVVDALDGEEIYIPGKLYGHFAKNVSHGYATLSQRQDAALQCADNSNQEARIAAAASVALALNDQWQYVWPLFEQHGDPTTYSLTVQYLAACRTPTGPILERIGNTNDHQILSNLILVVGTFAPNFSTQNRELALSCFTQIHPAEHPCDVRHALSWATRRMGMSAESTAAEFKKMGSRSAKNDRWQQLQDGKTLSDFPISLLIQPRPLESPMVCFDTGIVHRKDDAGYEYQIQIAHPYAVGTTQVTVEDFERFRPDHESDQSTSPHPRCPVNNVTWYDATAYCNWLSGQCGIPKKEWCYLPNRNGQYAEGMSTAPNATQRQGFRLPTVAESEYASRGSVATQWSFGNDPIVGTSYAWYQQNSGSRTHRVGQLMPNASGLFDNHGNVWEWCHDGPSTSTGSDHLSAKLEMRFLTGGTYLNAATLFEFGSSENSNPLTNATGADGFRICRTLPEN